MDYKLFSTQNLVDGDNSLEIEIVVGGTQTTGVYIGSNSGGSTGTATVITQCNQGASVQVKALNSGAQRWGTFDGILVSAFSGTILALL